jgi:alpha-L-rhamnosidase
MYLSVMPEAYVKDSTMTLGSGWSDAGVIIPWNLYQNTGDISYIEDSYEAIKAYLEVVRARGIAQRDLVTGYLRQRLPYLI